MFWNRKKQLNLENTGDKIKFLNEIAKILSKVENTMEREIYIEKIAKGYNISKEAIYAEVNKLIYVGTKEDKVSQNKISVLFDFMNSFFKFVLEIPCNSFNFLNKSSILLYFLNLL